ncbi:MAG: hypothetical protein B7W98_02110, partial [Parcubacteria group bacterium 20-58-5]
MTESTISSTPLPAASSAASFTPLERAQNKLYEIAGGSIDSGNVQAARLTTKQRMDYFRSPEFRDWVASENAAGRQVFWLKDVDKTQGAGDLFTFFYKWRADNNKFSPRQLQVIADFLLGLESRWGRFVARFQSARLKAPRLAPEAVIKTWLAKEDGGKGIGMLDFWSGAYWPSQIGLSRAEKLAQVQAFA